MTPSIDEIARRMMVPSRGILAADESERTMMTKRLALVGAPETSESARQFRDLLFTTQGLEDYLSSVILFEETLRHVSNDGVPFPHLLESKGIIPGVKVDQGLVPLPKFPDEEISKGLDSLDVRLDEYYELGARFTKWRSVIRITEELPSEAVVRMNAHVLARYAAIVQSHNMVPMVEPEVLFEGTHTIERSAEVLRFTLKTLFDELLAQRVLLPGLILKTSMALPGKESGTPLDAPSVARETVAALKDSVPTMTGGVVFLSGGQTPIEATENLNCIAQHDRLPWGVTFSYSRALEEPVLEAWRGVEENRDVAQKALLHRLQLNVAAQQGVYRKEME